MSDEEPQNVVDESLADSKDKKKKPVKATKAAKAAKGAAAAAKAADNQDDSQHEHTFDSADAGASTTYPMQCSALRKGGYVCIKSRPCKIVDMSTSKTGKHGHAKVHLVAIDIFNQKKLEDLCPSTHNMDVPNVTSDSYDLIDLNEEDGFLSLMDKDGNTREDVKLPTGSEKAEEVNKEIRRLFELQKVDNREITVVVTKAMGEEIPTEVKSTDGK